MIDRHLNVGSQVVLDKQNLDLLITTLAAEGFTTVGPRIDNELIVYSKIEGTKDLPTGILISSLVAIPGSNSFSLPAMSSFPWLRIPIGGSLKMIKTHHDSHYLA
jgi:hypothetical protein